MTLFRYFWPWVTLDDLSTITLKNDLNGKACEIWAFPGSMTFSDPEWPLNYFFVGVSQYYLLGDRRYRPICNHTVKFSAENSVFKNFAKSSLPVSDRTKSERPFAHRSGSVSNVVFSLLFSLIKIFKIEINSHPGGVRYNLRWQMVSVKTL